MAKTTPVERKNPPVDKRCICKLTSFLSSFFDPLKRFCTCTLKQQLLSNNLLNMPNIIPVPSWKSWQKFVFRFLFLFLGFFLLNYELVFVSFHFNFFDSLSKIYATAAQPLSWLDNHLYHTGYNHRLHQAVPGDNHFGIVFYFTLVILIILVVIVWSIVDRQRLQYNKLYYWFRLYIRYMVALIMFGYGIDKLIPVQMSYPDITDLLAPLGEQSRFSILWNFVGSSPGYEVFTGICEVTGSLLLIFRRTYIFGSLFMCTILCNVVALNIFYNIPVKLYSSLLLISILFLLAPSISKLVQFFFGGRAVSLAEYQYKFKQSWKNHLIVALGICIPVLSFLNDTFHVNNRYHQYENNRKREKLYDVTYFITKDTLSPLLTDTLRWRRFAFANKNSAVIYNMLDKAGYYTCDTDSVNHTYTLHDNPDTSTWHVFHYSYPGKSILQLSGTWKGSEVKISMKEVPTDSMNLNKERIQFVRD
jgi:hypothetical protein